MNSTHVELYNFPTTFSATATPRQSGILVVIEDKSQPFFEILLDTCSVSREISWSDYSNDGMRAVECAAYALAEKLRNNQFGHAK